ncbi:MAG: hypothetical protein ACR2LC_09700 [Pyrinomonadaceae bacterium]
MNFKSDVPTVEKNLSDGTIAHCRRIDFRLWQMFGQVPAALTEIASDVAKATLTPKEAELLAEQKVKAITEEEDARLKIFMREVFVETILYPRIVLGGQSPDELDPKRLDFEKDVLGIYRWQLMGAPGVPVKMEGGESLPSGALENFPQGSSRKSASRARTHRRKVRSKAK